MTKEDPDLSRTFSHRSKLKSLRSSRSVDPNRTFGVPSIRTDLLMNKDKISVSNFTNFGDEKDVYELLYPNIHLVYGMEQEGLQQKITKDEVSLTN